MTSPAPELGQHAASERVRASEPVLPAQSREDTDAAWGEFPAADEDERLYRDRPPHWDDF
jgi:hypothetical protein